MEIGTAFMPAPSPPPEAGDAHLWQDGEFSFRDVIDAINPLHHLPVIGTIYRAITGDTIGNAARLIGAGLFGGPLGLIGGMVAVAVKDKTGLDPGEHIAALVTGEPPPAAVYAGTPAPAPPAPGPAPAASVAQAPAAAESGVTGSSTPPALLHSAALKLPVLADHAPMPLARAQMPLVGKVGPNAAAQEFLAQRATAMREPGVTPARGHPVPIQAVAMPRARPAAGASVAPAAVSSPTGGTAEPSADVARQMMDALDKYARLQTARSAPQVDIVQ